MKSKIVKIGNSQGLRIPKVILEQAGLSEDVEIVVEGNRLVITARRSPRDGWASAFKNMAKAGDDKLLDRDASSTSSFDEEEWSWE